MQAVKSANRKLLRSSRVTTLSCSNYSSYHGVYSTTYFRRSYILGLIYRALVFLVISCPCALVVSIPLGFFGGIGGASKSGVLVKGVTI